MQKLLLIPVLALLCLHVRAQLPEDLLRSSWVTPSGTARQQAIGGAMGSLGGEISANYVNPAGLGLYRTNEFVISPGLRFDKENAKYLGTHTSAAGLTGFNLGTSGFVTSYEGVGGNFNVFSIAVNRTADFNSHTHYSGRNDYSSFAEQYAEEFSASHLGINQGIASPSLSYGTRMALWTSLIDTAADGNGGQMIIAQPQKAGLLLQDNDITTSGGITEIALNLASGIKNKLFFGGGIGIPIMRYNRSQTWYEADATGNANNDFESFTYRETFTSKAWGLNAKFGMLLKIGSAWRIGMAIHSPTIYGVTDRFNASMITRTENYTDLKQVSISSDSLDNIVGNQPAGAISYNMLTPWKFILSGAYVFGSNIADTRKQKGFVTADLEYHTLRSAHFKPENNQDESTNNYFDAVNAAAKTSYTNFLSMRLGGEMKFNTLMARAGAAFYSNPYKDNALKANRMLFSLGGGYRYAGMFVDLAFIMAFEKNVNIPYLLSDKSNVYADLTHRTGTLLLTFGIKL